MKTYVIILAKQFPVGHSRVGEPTYFREKFLNAVSGEEATLTEGCHDIRLVYGEKVHTIRANYTLWAKRIAEVECGEACLSIRQWTGKPYRSKQVELARLTSSSGVGIQRLHFPEGDIASPIVRGSRFCMVDLEVLSRNDGLSYSDWYRWFKKYDLTKPMAIIHFTPFRY